MKYWHRIQARRNILARGVLAAFLLLTAGSTIAQDGRVPDSNDAGFRRVCNRLLCQCGCGYMVLSCNMVDCSSALYIRNTIQTSLADGKSEDAIVASFVERYGPRILPEPPKSGFSLTAWVMPFAVLLIGGMLVSYILWHWKYRFSPAGDSPDDVIGDASPAPPASPAANAALLDKYRAQIERDLEE